MASETDSFSFVQSTTAESAETSQKSGGVQYGSTVVRQSLKMTRILTVAIVLIVSTLIRSRTVQISLQI
jgi:hypothetical protein